MKNVVVYPQVRSKRAFTLIELLVVIAIIATLAAVSSRIIGSVVATQNRNRAVAELSAMGTGLEAFKGMYNDYPRINQKSDSKAPQLLYRCLTGMTFMNIENNQIVFRDLGSVDNLKTFVDPSSVTVGTGDMYEIDSLMPASDNKDDKKKDSKIDKDKGGDKPKNAEKPKSDMLVASTSEFDDTNSCFVDPWGVPYLYYYNSSFMIGAIGSWEGTSYLLLSAGPDNTHAEVRSMYSTGIMPDAETYRDANAIVNNKMGYPNVDNIVYGYDD
jgi:prepilin-type N-terminal cleavage/methylation domain